MSNTNNTGEKVNFSCLRYGFLPKYAVDYPDVAQHKW